MAKAELSKNLLKLNGQVIIFKNDKLYIRWEKSFIKSIDCWIQKKITE